MNKKILTTSLLTAVFSISAFATEIQMPSKPNIPEGTTPRPEAKMPNFTEDQKNCIQQFGCNFQPPFETENTEKPKHFDKEEFQPSTLPQMSEEQKENQECLKKAMQECGIEMPEPQKIPGQQRPQHTND